MEVARQLPTGRVAAPGKRSGGVPPPSKHPIFAVGAKRNENTLQPSKQPVSATAVFKQHPRTAQKAARPIQHALKMIKPARVKPGSSSSPRNVGRSDLRRQGDLHPLTAAFSDTTQAYRNTLYENATKKLDDTLLHLLTQLHDSNMTTVSSPPRASDPSGSPQKLSIADKADRTAEKLFRKAGSYELTTGKGGTVETLDEGMNAFSAKHENTVEEIRKLEMKWMAAVGEIWKVGVDCLGEEAMFTLLLPQAVPPSPPFHAEDEYTTLVDLEPKSTKKKVTFQEPSPEPPKFLYAASKYKDALSSPPKVSEQDVKTLEAKIDALGTAQIDGLVKINKDSKEWWSQKAKQIATLLKE